MLFAKTLRRLTILAMVAPVIGRVVEAAAARRERSKGASATTQRVRHAGAFLRGGGLRRYLP